MAKKSKKLKKSNTGASDTSVNDPKQDKTKESKIATNKQKARQNAEKAQGIYGGVIDELKKVTWPNKADTTRLTMVVVVISLIVGAYIGIIDTLFAEGLRYLAGN